MQIGKRNLTRLAGSLFERRHYVSLINMARFSIPFGETLKRYLFGGGEYPYRAKVKTPIGIISPMLYSYYDLLTMNEIFFRGDYKAGPTDTVFVDFGSNIGLSALYFLTRNPKARVYLFEPDPVNIERLTRNLADFKDRIVLNPTAVSNQEGIVRFGQDVISGRYGGIGVETGHYIDVKCRHVNAVLEEIFQKEEKIDLLKIDTEGAELSTVKAIKPEFLQKIDDIYMECQADGILFPRLFVQSQEGTVCHLVNRTPL